MNKVFLLVLLVLLCLIVYFCLNLTENFSEVSLENQVCLYNSYRNLINGRASNDSNSRCNNIPYTLNTNCFANKRMCGRKPSFNLIYFIYDN